MFFFKLFISLNGRTSQNATKSGLLYISTMLITFLHKVMCDKSDLVLTEDWLQNYLNAMKGVIGKIICNLVPRVSHLTAPWGERGINERPWERGWIICSCVIYSLK